MSVAKRWSARARPRGVWALLSGLLLGFTLSACSDGAAADADTEADEPGELAIFVYDRSWSIPDYSLELARDLTAQRLRTLDHGDRIAALEVLQRSLAEPPKRWSQAVPEREFPGQDVPRDSVTLARFLRDARDYLVAYADTAGRREIMGTDLLSTLHDVAAEVRAAPDHRATMYLFSDMLQSTPEIEMEGMRRMPGPDWVDSAKAAGKLPDLEGLCVVVIGARVDTDAAQRVKEFWKEYFEATGAKLYDSNYMLRPVTVPERPC